MYRKYSTGSFQEYVYAMRILNEKHAQKQGYVLVLLISFWLAKARCTKTAEYPRAAYIFNCRRLLGISIRLLSTELVVKFRMYKWPGIRFQALWHVFRSFIGFFCLVLYENSRVKKLYCACLATLFQTATLRLLPRASCYSLSRPRRFLRPSPLFRQRSFLQVVKIYNSTYCAELLSPSFRKPLFRRISFKKFLPRTT